MTSPPPQSRGAGAGPSRHPALPVWGRFTFSSPKPAYVPPPPPLSFHPENVQTAADGTVTMTYRWDNVTGLLRDLPISVASLRVKIIRNLDGKFTAEIYGYSPKREFGPQLQRMVEANQRQNGQKTLGAPLIEASLSRLVDKFNTLDEIGQGTKSASGWGRVGLAVIACVSLENATDLEATVTTRKNHEIIIKLNGFCLPEFFAEEIAAMVEKILPATCILHKHELDYYCKKAASMKRLPVQFSRPNLLAASATAADFPAEVTALPAMEMSGEAKEVAASPGPTLQGQQALATDRLNTAYKQGPAILNPYQQPAMNNFTALKMADLFCGTQHVPSQSPRYMNSHHRDTYGETSLGPTHTTTILPGQVSMDYGAHADAIQRFGQTNPSRYEDHFKRTHDDDEETSNIFSSNKKIKSSKQTNSSTCRGIGKSRGEDTTSALSPPPNNSSSMPPLTDANVPAPGIKKPRPVKPTPTSREIHRSWKDGKMGQYTVPQLRSYLRQERMMGDLRHNARRDDFLRKIQAVEGPKEGMPWSGEEEGEEEEGEEEGRPSVGLMAGKPPPVSLAALKKVAIKYEALLAERGMSGVE